MCLSRGPGGGGSSDQKDVLKLEAKLVCGICATGWSLFKEGRENREEGKTGGALLSWFFFVLEFHRNIASCFLLKCVVCPPRLVISVWQWLSMIVIFHLRTFEQEMLGIVPGIFCMPTTFFTNLVILLIAWGLTMLEYFTSSSTWEPLMIYAGDWNILNATEPLSFPS